MYLQRKRQKFWQIQNDWPEYHIYSGDSKTQLFIFFFSFWGQISISVCEIVSADEAEFSNSPCAAEHPIPNTNPHAPYRSVVDSMLGLEVKLRCSDVVTSLLSFTSSGRMCWSSMPLGLLLQGLFCKLVWYEVLHFPSRCLADEAAGAAWPFSRARLDLLLMALI